MEIKEWNTHTLFDPDFLIGKYNSEGAVPATYSAFTNLIATHKLKPTEPVDTFKVVKG